MPAIVFVRSKSRKQNLSLIESETSIEKSFQVNSKAKTLKKKKIQELTHTQNDVQVFARSI